MSFTGLVEATPEFRAEVEGGMAVCAPVSADQLPDFKTLLKPENDPRAWHLKAELQSRNDCQANALTSGVEVVEWRAKGKRGELSRSFAYQMCESVMGWLGRDSGTSIQSGVKVAKEIGCPLESEYPYARYTGNARQFQGWCTPEIMASAATRKIVDAAPAPDWPTMLAHCALGQPTHWGTAWSLDFSTEPETGHKIARSYARHGQFGHAHELVWPIQLRTGEWVCMDWNSHGDEFFLITEKFYYECIRTSPYGAYVLLGTKEPVKQFYDKQFHVMG